ncbi:MAG: hypothetical protein Fur0016_30770 [Anaerolineales bacterium]
MSDGEHTLTFRAATALALAERKRRKDEESRQAAEEQRKAAARNAAEALQKIQNWLIGQQIKKAQEEAARQAQQRAMDVNNNRPEDQPMQKRQLLFANAFQRPVKPDGIPNNYVEIPPLTSQQYVALKNWNVAAQVGVYGITTMIGAAIGLMFLKHPVAGVIGAVGGVMWGAYEANCIASVQEQFDKAHERNGSVQVWREGRWAFGVYGGGDTYTVANGPLSAAYVAVTTFLLTEKLP